jgi:lysophospholipase L1-like esterase
MATSAVKVQLFGHSFVRRLREFIKNGSNQRYDLNIQRNPLVQFSGISGATVPVLRQHLELVSDFSPDIVVLVIGTNDIFKSDVSPKSVACSITDLVDTLLFMIGVQKVIVLQVLHRCNPSIRSNYPVDVDWYNARVDELNSHLLEMLNHTTPKRSYLWRMKGFWSTACKQRNFATDGCHLSNSGQLRLISNIRAAVVAALKRSICQE